MLISVMYGYEKTEYCDEVNRVLCIPYDSYEVSDWEGLRSNYFKYSLLREETQKKLSEIGVVEEVNITGLSRYGRHAFVLY